MTPNDATMRRYLKRKYGADCVLYSVQLEWNSILGRSYVVTIGFPDRYGMPRDPDHPDNRSLRMTDEDYANIVEIMWEWQPVNIGTV